METILGKAPAIFNGHQLPRAVDPYMQYRTCQYTHNIWSEPAKVQLTYLVPTEE